MRSFSSCAASITFDPPVGPGRCWRSIDHPFLAIPEGRPVEVRCDRDETSDLGLCADHLAELREVPA